MKAPAFKDVVFQHLNERFLPNRTGDIIFFNNFHDAYMYTSHIYKQLTRRYMPKAGSFPPAHCLSGRLLQSEQMLVHEAKSLGASDRMN